MFCRRHDCKWAACLLWLFTAGLGILLTVQIPFVVLFVLDREVRIPSKWVEYAISHSVGEEYEVSIGPVRLNKWGTVRIEEATLKNRTGRMVAQASSLQVDLFLPSVIFGIFTPQEVEIRNLTLYDFLGPLRAEEPILEVEGICLIKSKSSWNIEDARIRIGNLLVAAAGEVSQRVLRPQFKEKTTDGQLEEMIQQVQQLEKQLARLKNPFLRIEVNSEGREHAEASIVLTADRAELPYSTSLEDEVRFSARVQLVNSEIGPLDIRLSSRMAYVDQTSRILSPKVSLNLPGGLSFPSAITAATAGFTASEIATPEIVLEAPTVATTTKNGFPVQFHGQVGILERPFLVRGTVHPFQQKADLEIAGVLDVRKALYHPGIPAKARNLSVDFGEGVYLQASTSVSRNNLIPDSIQFRAKTTGPVQIREFDALFASGIGEFLPKETSVSIRKLDVQMKDYHFEGKYDHNLRTNLFRFLVRGGFIPTDINSFMKDWWDEIWPTFIIREPAYVDFDISGDYDHNDEREMFGGVRFSNISYRGMRIDKGHATMWSFPYFFEFFDLQAFRPEGKASGSMAIILEPDTRQDYAIRYDFLSRFDFVEAAPLFGKKIVEIGADFTLTGAPEILIQGVLFDESYYKPTPPNNLRIEASTDKPLTYRDIDLERFSLKGVYNQDGLRLDPITFGLGKGTGEGWLFQRADQNDPEISTAYLNFKGGEPSAVVDAIPLLRENMKDRLTVDPDDDPEDRNLDFSIECTGDFENPETLLGEGYIDLETPNLANVRLLGIFSLISEQFPLPITLGSFKFDRVSTSFLLNRGLIEFPNLTLHSPSSRLLASGSYDLPKETIDFDARMELLGEVKFPILAQLSALLRPVGKVFEFKVWGELDDPQWRLYLDPRSW